MNTSSIKLLGPIWLIAALGCSQSPTKTANPAATGDNQQPAQRGSTVSPTGTIGLSVLTLTNPFFKVIADSMKEEAAKHGYEVIVTSGEFDVAKQQNQVKDFIVNNCAAIVTWAEQHPTGAAAAQQLAADIVGQFGCPTRVLIAVRDIQEDVAFADTLSEQLTKAGCTVVATVKGQPQDARRAISGVVDVGDHIDVIAANQVTATWSVFENLETKFPSLAGAKVVQPRSYRWPNFLKATNLMNIADQIAVIAILAVGMTLVIITGGIDLSVGSLFGIPNAVVLMAMLYCLAHLLMTRMPLGRYIYAVGGNIEAARLSGVHVSRVLFFSYTVCGALAGLGGVVIASQLKSGSPTYGLMYELYTIAAMVVGGTSLSDGEGRILGTLIGVFIIAVIQNGMNLTGVESYTQKVVLGLVILGAVLLDMLKRRVWRKT